MSTPVYTIHPEKCIEECMALMRVTHMRHMPVLDEGKLVGIISMGDVVNEIIIRQRIEIEDLRSYVYGGYSSEWTAS